MEISNRTSIKEFTYQLASSSPTPGGGSVAALVASLSSGLSGMVFNLTVNKKSFEEYDEDVKRLIDDSLKKVSILMDDFLRLIDEDVRVFNEFIDILKLPRETEEQRDFRDKRLQEGYIMAMNIPLETLRKVYELFEFFEVGADYGNKGLISDVGVGVILAYGAVESSIINVKVNLRGIRDKKIVEEVGRECSKILEDSRNKKDRIMERVNRELLSI